MNLQDGAGSSGFIQGKMRDVLLTKLRPREKDLTEKIRTALRGQPIEEVLRRIAGSTSKDAKITEEDLIVGVSKLNANLHLGELKEFITALKGVAAQPGDNRISLQDTLQLIAQ